MHYIKSQSRVLAFFVSIGAFLVSCGALLLSSSQYDVATKQDAVVERHYRLSVKTHVNVIFYLEGRRDQKNGIYLANRGLGPAVIKAVSVEVGGKSYRASYKHPWRSALRDLNIIANCFK